MKKFFLLVVLGMIFLCNGCAALPVLEESSMVEEVMKEQEKEGQMLKAFNRKLASMLVQFRCPQQNSFEHEEIVAGFSAIFNEGKEARAQWDWEMYNLVQELSQGKVYVNEAKIQYKYGLYDKGEELYFLVHSSEESRGYLIKKKFHNSFKCKERSGKKFARELSGG